MELPYRRRKNLGTKPPKKRTHDHETSKKTRRAKTETVAVYDIDEAISEAVQTFNPSDAVCFLGDAYCPLADLTAWLQTLPAAQRAQRRYAIGVGHVTERKTGKMMAPYVTLDRVPEHAFVCPHGVAQIERTEMTFILFIQSLSFLRNEMGWDTMRRVQPAALDESGLTFKDA